MALPQIVLPIYELELSSSGKKVKYRPFVVKEEKLLLLALETNDEIQIEKSVKSLLEGCIQTKGIKVSDMPLFDLEYLFLNIRAVSVGEKVDMNVTCKDDETTVVKYVLDLTQVQVTKPEGHSNKIMISDTMGVMMKYPSFPEFVKNSIMGKSATTDGVVEIIANCIEQIFDGDDVYDSSTTTKKEFVQFVEGFTNQQYEKLSAFFEDIPRLEHNFKLTNPVTKVESDYTIAGLANFFG